MVSFAKGTLVKCLNTIQAGDMMCGKGINPYGTTGCLDGYTAGLCLRVVIWSAVHSLWHFWRQCKSSVFVQEEPGYGDASQQISELLCSQFHR